MCHMKNKFIILLVLGHCLNAQLNIPTASVVTGSTASVLASPCAAGVNTNNLAVVKDSPGYDFLICSNDYGNYAWNGVRSGKVMQRATDPGFSFAGLGTAATLATVNGVLQLKIPNSSSQIAYKAIPSTPYAVTVILAANPIVQAYTTMGLAVTDNTSPRNLAMVQITGNTGGGSYLAFGNYSNYYTYVSSGASSYSAYAPIHGFCITDDGTTLTYWYSGDGVTWLQAYTNPRTTYLTPANWAIFGSTGITVPVQVSYINILALYINTAATCKY